MSEEVRTENCSDVSHIVQSCGRNVHKFYGMHDMEKIHSKLRRTDYYDFGHGLTLMNVLFKTEDGKLDRIDTYIGVEGNEFVCVGCAKDLSAPGVIFSYGEYVRFQRANKATYLEFFKQNSRSHIIVDGCAYTIDQFLKLY